MPFIIGLISVFTISAGFVVLHFTLTHRTTELKAAGWTLVIGGLVSLFGAFYFVPSPFCDEMRPRMEHGMWDGKRKQCARKQLQEQEKMTLEAPPLPEAKPDAAAKVLKPATTINKL